MSKKTFISFLFVFSVYLLDDVSQFANAAETSPLENQIKCETVLTNFAHYSLPTSKDRHTIEPERISQYIDKQIGSSVIKDLNRSEKSVIFAIGEVSAALNKLNHLGWKLQKSIAKEEGFHLIYTANNVFTHENAYVIVRVNTEERLIHLKSLLTLSDIAQHRVQVIGEIQPQYLNFKKSIASEHTNPELVVYGFPNSVLDAIIALNPESSVHAEKIREMYGLKNRRLNLEDNELSNMWITKVTLSNKKIIWLVPSLYGSMAKDFFEALHERKIKRVLYMGTSGNLDGSRNVGDFYTPVFARDNEKTISLNFLKPIMGILPSGTYSRVPSFLIETEDWLEKSLAKGITDVEVELGYALQIYQNEPNFSATLITSDVLTGAHKQDITNQNYDFFKKLVPKFKLIMGDILKELALDSKVIEISAFGLGHTPSKGSE